MRFIWSTRGRDWGFRFLRDAGLSDPLIAFEAAFSGLDGDPEVCATSGDQTALRFLDPDGRSDHAGRPILHEFVVFDNAIPDGTTVDEAQAVVWPLVSEEYAALWLAGRDPFSTDR